MVAYKFYVIHAYRKELEQESFSDESLTDVSEPQPISKLYDFDSHLSVNKKFNVWCNRCITAFICEMCIIAIIVCAVKIKK